MESIARKKLSTIQQELKAPKSQFNAFGKYNYRNQEDILEAVKPLLGEATVTLSDEIVEVGGRVYVRATATLAVETDLVSVTAFAREPEEQKGMNSSQVTGSASSYARKYALNGLFAIDDTKDADSQDNRKQEKKVEKSVKSSPATVKQLDEINQLLIDKSRSADKYLEFYKVDDLEKLNVVQAHSIIKNLKEIQFDEEIN